MRRMSLVGYTVALMAVLAALAGCGSADSSSPVTQTQDANTTAPATQGGTAQNSAVSPDRLCAMVSTAQMSTITGFNITGTTAEMSGDVSVCGYVGITDGYQSTKLFTQYQPTGKGALEYTKARGEAVSGFDNTAVWFQTGGQLLIELGGEAVFGVYVSDVRMHGNDPRAGAMLIAQIAVPALT
jgi:hypothetical protein